MTFVKGESGNPNGRPKKGHSLSDLLLSALAEKGQKGIPKRKELMQVLLDMALAGDLDAIKVVLDRSDGKVLEKHQHTGSEGGPIEVKTYVSISPDDWPDR